jgi:hypothetical protein
VLVALPYGVVAETRPDVAPTGTLVLISSAVALVTCESVTLNLAALVVGVVWKLVPAMFTAVPGLPILGVNPVTVGLFARPMVKGCVLEVEPVGVVTVMSPVDAPMGTVVTISVLEADTIVASAPLNLTLSCVVVALNPVP